MTSQNVIEDIVSQGHGHLEPSYLFVHSTANPGATAENHRNAAANGNWKYVTQYVCDWTGTVYHLMPDDRLAWAVGNGNRYGVNLEICEGRNEVEFVGSWDTAVEFCAWYLTSRGWGIDRMMSHDECRIRWGGTDHTDPNPYFKRFGRSWEQFVAEVKATMEGNAREDELIRIDIPKGTYPVYRAYRADTDDHFLTGSKAERDALPNTYSHEGVAFQSADRGEVVYRLYNPNAGQHMYTTDFDEAQSLVDAGWQAETVTFASARNVMPVKPVYRLYNPNTGAHHFTADIAGRDHLVSVGWNDEGIGWYAAC